MGNFSLVRIAISCHYFPLDTFQCDERGELIRLLQSEFTETQIDQLKGMDVSDDILF